MVAPSAIVWVMLSPQDDKRAIEIATATELAARGYQDANGLIITEEESLEVRISAMRSEILVRNYCQPCTWLSEIIEYEPGRPDILRGNKKIDVKCVDAEHKRLLVQKGKCMGSWYYVLVDASRHPLYGLIGWKRGFDIGKYDLTEPQPDRPARLVPRGDLEPMAQLIAVASIGRRCHCGAWATQSIGSFLLKGIEGQWFCGQHIAQAKGLNNGGAKGLSDDNVGRHQASDPGWLQSADGADADWCGEDQAGGINGEERAGQEQADYFRSASHQPSRSDGGVVPQRRHPRNRRDTGQPLFDRLE